MSPPPPRAYLQEGEYHICIFIFILQIVAHAKITVNTSVFWIHYISIAITCLKKHPIMQNQNPVPHFQKFDQKMKTLCTNSEVHHQKPQGKCIFFGINNIISHKTFIKPARAQDSQESRWTKCRIHAQAQDSQESPRLFGTLSGSCLIVPKNLGILGNLGPVHESCTLFIGILGNLGPVQVLFPSVI